jgi:hypothetical protein
MVPGSSARAQQRVRSEPHANAEYRNIGKTPGELRHQVGCQSFAEEDLLAGVSHQGRGHKDAIIRENAWIGVAG